MNMKTMPNFADLRTLAYEDPVLFLAQLPEMQDQKEWTPLMEDYFRDHKADLCARDPRLPWKAALQRLIWWLSQENMVLEWNDYQDRKNIMLSIPQEAMHAFACDCAEKSLENVRKAGIETDKRSWKAIEITRAWMQGKASKREVQNAVGAANAARAALDAVDATEYAVAYAVHAADAAACSTAYEAAAYAVHAADAAADASRAAVHAVADTPYAAGRDRKSVV